MPYGVLGTVGARRSRTGLLRPSAKRLPSATADYTLTIGGVDMMPYLLAHSPKVKATGYSQNATFSFTLNGDPDGVLAAVEVEQEVHWNDGTRDVFAGIVRAITPSDINREDWVYMQIDCQAFITYLDDNIITTGNRAVTAESDGTRIKWLIDTFCTTGLTYAHVQDLVNIMPAFDYTGMTLAQAISSILGQSRGSYYVDYDKDIHTFLNEAHSAPFNVSDHPNDDTTFGYAPGSLTWPKDSVQLRNAIYAIPTAGGTAVATWYTDGASIAYYGRREAVLKSSNKNQVDLDLEGAAVLASNRYPHGSGQFVCFQPGLEAGMDIRITSVLYGIWNQKFRIQAVTTTYPIDATGPEGTGAQYMVDFGDSPFVVQAATISVSAGAQATSRYLTVPTYRSVIIKHHPVVWWKMSDASGTLIDAVGGLPAYVSPAVAPGTSSVYNLAGAVPGSAGLDKAIEITTVYSDPTHRPWFLCDQRYGSMPIRGDLSGDYVNPFSTFKYADNFSFEFWIKPLLDEQGNSVINNYGGQPVLTPTNPHWGINVHGDWQVGVENQWNRSGLVLALDIGVGAYKVDGGNGTSDNAVNTGGNWDSYDSLTVGAWSHVFVRAKAGIWTVFVDGAIRLVVNHGPAVNEEREAFSIGGSPWANDSGLVAVMDEIAIYDYPLTNAEIQLHHSIGVSGPY